MDINRIRNTTLAKLTAREIGELDLLNYGVMTYRGTLKSKRQGWKTVKVSETETDFIYKDLFRVEFIKIVSTEDEETHWAMRLVDIPTGKYEEGLQPLSGINFLK